MHQDGRFDKVNQFLYRHIFQNPYGCHFIYLLIHCDNFHLETEDGYYKTTVRGKMLKVYCVMNETIGAKTYIDLNTTTYTTHPTLLTSTTVSFSRVGLSIDECVVSIVANDFAFASYTPRRNIENYYGKS